jgi:hypothetical protein
MMQRATREPLYESMRARSPPRLSTLSGWARCFVCSMLCVSFVPSAFAQGGPPMLTDDAGTPGSGVWEINAAYLEERTSQERLRSFPHVDFNYGLGEHIQLKYETGWAFADTSEGVKSGLDDSLLGLKWRFLDQSSSGVDMSVYPQLQLENSSYSVAQGIALPGPNFFLPVEIEREFGRIKVVGEVGYQYFHAEQNEWVVGLLGSLQASDALELMAEVRIFSGNLSENLLTRGDVILNVGLRHALGSGFKLLASVGTGISSGPQATSFIAYLGVQVVLGEEKHQ